MRHVFEGGEIVRGEQNRAAGGDLRANERGEGGARPGVEAFEGFVQQEDVRFLRERRGEEQAARFAAGERGGVPRGERREGRGGERAVHRLFVAAREGTEKTDVREAPGADRIAHREAGEGADVGRLRQICDASGIGRAGERGGVRTGQQDAPRGGRKGAGERAQQRRLAGAVRADEQRQFPGRKRVRKTVENGFGAEAHGEVFAGERGHLERE